MIQCKICQKEFKRPQDLIMHNTKVHKKKESNGPNGRFSKNDLIQILEVKINALQDVQQMLRSL